VNAATKIPTSAVGLSAGGNVRNIGIAEIGTVAAPECIRTVLGSCIGVALYDRVAKVGGMAHVILPSSKEGSGDPGKFADTAVDLLVQKVLAAGATKERLASKISGGASMFGTVSETGLGARNEEAVRARLQHHSVRVAGAHCGGTKGRKMSLDPSSGEVTVEIIGEDKHSI